MIKTLIPKGWVFFNKKLRTEEEEGAECPKECKHNVSDAHDQNSNTQGGCSSFSLFLGNHFQLLVIYKGSAGVAVYRSIVKVDSWRKEIRRES